MRGSNVSLVKRSKQAAIILACLQMGVGIPCYALGGVVHIGGQSVITVPTTGAASSTERAKQIQNNIDNSLVAATNRTPSTVKITYVKGQPVITLGGYYVAAVDPATAKAEKTTPAILAQKWVNQLKAALANKSNVNAYLAQLTGAPTVSKPASIPSQVASKPKASPAAKSSPQNYSAPRSQSTASASSGDSNNSGSYSDSGSTYNKGTFQRARVAYVPAGMTMSMKLSTALSSQVSKPGDVVMASLTEPVVLGDATIPANTVISGHVTKSSNGAYLSKSGRLGVKFTSMRTPDGVDTPINAHIVGTLGKFHEVSDGSDEFRGETGETKIKKALVGAAVGAGSGLLLGTAIGAIAGGGRGAGRGAVSTMAIGAGVGALAGGLLLKGRNVSVGSNETVKLQLDAPATFALSSYSGQF